MMWEVRRRLTSLHRAAAPGDEVFRGLTSRREPVGGTGEGNASSAVPTRHVGNVPRRVCVSPGGLLVALVPSPPPRLDTSSLGYVHLGLHGWARRPTRYGERTCGDGLGRASNKTVCLGGTTEAAVTGKILLPARGELAGNK